jgi:hypothetical protein
MKNLSLMVLLFLLCGCAHEYVMKLSNGVTLTTANKPKLKGSYYHYKGPKGEEQVIPQSRVLEIEPASMAKEENKFTPSEPKKKKWYWPF